MSAQDVRGKGEGGGYFFLTWHKNCKVLCPLEFAPSPLQRSGFQKIVRSCVAKFPKVPI